VTCDEAKVGIHTLTERKPHARGLSLLIADLMRGGGEGVEDVCGLLQELPGIFCKEFILMGGARLAGSSFLYL
jgi:hypothetical protein